MSETTTMADNWEADGRADEAGRQRERRAWECRRMSRRGVWYRAESGNPTRKVKGVRLTVFPSRHGGYSVVVAAPGEGPVYFGPYATEDEAIDAADVAVAEAKRAARR